MWRSTYPWTRFCFYVIKVTFSNSQLAYFCKVNQ